MGREFRLAFAAFWAEQKYGGQQKNAVTTIRQWKAVRFKCIVRVFVLRYPPVPQRGFRSLKRYYFQNFGKVQNFAKVVRMAGFAL